MDQDFENKLIERARTAEFTAASIVEYYKNCLQRGAPESVLDAIYTRMWLEFPKAAKAMFGAKGDDVTECLTRIHEDVAATYDLSRNKLKAGVKLGGTERTGEQRLYRYLSYRGADHIGAQLALIQQDVESELVIMVRHYRTMAQEQNFSEEQLFPFGELERAVDEYKKLLAMLGVERIAP